MTHPHCIDDEILAAYFDGLLTEAQEQSLHQQAVACAHCREQLASVAVVVRETEHIPESFKVPTRLTRSAVDLFDQRTSQTSGLRLAIEWLEGALAPLRDSIQPSLGAAIPTRGKSALAEQRFDELRFNVRLGDTPFVIDMEVDGDEELALTVTPLQPLPAGTLLRLSCLGETRAVSSLGPEGARMMSLEPGRYALILEQSSRALGELDLELVR